jgi:hypothetical protein
MAWKACLAIVFNRAEMNRLHSAARDHIADRRQSESSRAGVV